MPSASWSAPSVCCLWRTGGYLTWPYPFPALFFIVGAPLFAALVWFFFRSPNSPIETDVVGKTIVEVALVVAAGATWISLGHPAVGLVFVVVAAVSGIVAARRETA
ncbi:YrdB family protein [Curtobacterium sp. MCPF17_052]|uniref:YrdB family protein n=1 Tax=Curtobacterium sp. MCPF17_052 TaxID=2175655 RepID=UPI0024DF8DDF|nr:YrdB family protein [Curtobacterium sp. MCPF17_052]WIB13609.1 YrdB family protein [Curtobacterium sp. MCPF17_052]